MPRRAGDIGVDTYGFDHKFQDMAEDFARTGDDGRVIWEAHFAEIEREYCQIEKLVNLDKPPPHGFKVACFPVKVENASAGWLPGGGVPAAGNLFGMPAQAPSRSIART